MKFFYLKLYEINNIYWDLNNACIDKRDNRYTYLHIDIDYSYEHDITKKQSLEYRTIQH